MAKAPRKTPAGRRANTRARTRTTTAVADDKKNSDMGKGALWAAGAIGILFLVYSIGNGNISFGDSSSYLAAVAPAQVAPSVPRTRSRVVGTMRCPWVIGPDGIKRPIGECFPLRR
jgi:hypothetical protein